MNISRRLIFKALSICLMSVAIGTAFLLAYVPKAIFDPLALLFNSGYSLMLGMGLFLNGEIFRFFERKYISWLQQPVKSVFIAVIVTIIYSSIVIFFTNWFWYIFIDNLTWQKFWLWFKSVIIWEYVILYVISSFSYARSFFNEWRRSVVEKEKLKSQALALQYETLSNQVNPHFLFNSLNVLLSLIDQNTNDAKRFTSQLSAFYRQILNLKDKQLIPVDEELAILRNYLDLQQIRFGNSLNVTMNINSDTSHLIIPLTLQILVENAFKHNILSPEQPLHLEIEQLNDKLLVRNTLQKRKIVIGQSQIGLQNLNERYNYLTGKDIVITETPQTFEVQIPLIESEI